MILKRKLILYNLYMKTILSTIILLLTLNTSFSQSRPFIDITINKKENQSKPSTINYHNATGSFLTASGVSFLIGLGLSVANIRIGENALTYTSLGYYGVSSIFLISAGVTMMKSRKSNSISFKDKSNLRYGFSKTGLSLKYSF